MWVCFQIEQLRCAALGRILHLARCPIVRQEQFVVTVNYPAIKERRLRVLDVGNIVSERFAEQRIPFDRLTLAQGRQ